MRRGSMATRPSRRRSRSSRPRPSRTRSTSTTCTTSTTSTTPRRRARRSRSRGPRRTSPWSSGMGRTATSRSPARPTAPRGTWAARRRRAPTSTRSTRSRSATPWATRCSTCRRATGTTTATCTCRPRPSSRSATSTARPLRRALRARRASRTGTTRTAPTRTHCVSGPRTSASRRRGAPMISSFSGLGSRGPPRRGRSSSLGASPWRRGCSR
mmetsp:Transcript_38403/g.94413  ORF Transcript_38403/g.94413 Transcript_38403/m.94413 type:complete len:213 (+) Transcript_38403:522-1160(+)